MRLFSDQKALLLTSYQDAGAKIGDAIADQAIAQAYRKIAGCLPWSYLQHRTQINTNAPYSAGTVGYVASTRIVTLSGGTWPSWAANALILLGQKEYAVQSVTDSTHLVLKADRCPLADITAGYAYTLMQIEYLLPADWMRTDEFVEMGTIWNLNPIQAGSQINLTRLFFNPSKPWQYLTRGSTYYGGRMCVEFGPPPNAAYTYDMSYFAQPRQRTLSNAYTTGTVSVSGTAVTGTNTNFTQAMVGCQLRQGTATAGPVGEYGVNGSMNENTIASVTDATHLTLTAAGAALGSVQYVIDDPIDIERGAMDEVFCRICEYEFAILSRNNNRQLKQQEMIQALQNARAMDVRMTPRPNVYVPVTPEMFAYANIIGRQ